MDFRLIRRFTDGSQEDSDYTIPLSEAHLGLRFKVPVPGKAWEVVEIITNTKPLQTLSLYSLTTTRKRSNGSASHG